ncbi:hypothetical protein N0V90_012143 [Kalmusia sp. IMI 367209]|nr:hypothetical protein N0V90_012143 [Kalmusia sp. IMI 367209]
MEVIGRNTKPGITVDTSFARHRGNVPHQVYPQESERKSGGSIRKQGWFGLGRSDTKNKGLGITKGTPQPGRQSEDRETSRFPRPSTDGKDPKTADSLTAGSKSWQEISPWDRPIPIGITVPSDSVTDFSPYQATRVRSDSDATLATPSIIVTPAAAMKSVWSPDTASDYTPARASSIYSRATFMPPSDSDVPPVPTLPADVQKLSTQKTSFDAQRDWHTGYPTRARTDTLESGDTAFEEEQDDLARKDRIMSTGTVFEEDDTPLREKKLYTLSVDTSTVPTPRRSQGWWNIITTPFVMSRRNSVWTQNGRHGDKTPDIPMVPAEYGTYRNSPSPSSTYPWSATDRSPSTHGDSPLRPPPSMSTAVTTPEVGERAHNNGISVTVINEASVKNFPVPQVTSLPSHAPTSSTHGSVFTTPEMTLLRSQQTPELSKASGTPPAPVRSVSPAVDTAANGAVSVPHYPHSQPQPINVNIEIHDRRIVANDQAGTASTAATTQPGHAVVVPVPTYTMSTATRNHTPPQGAPFFPPPPNNDNNNTASRSHTPPQGAPFFPPPPDNNTASKTHTPPQTAPFFPPPNGNTAPSSHTPPQAAPFFPPPPHSTLKDKHFSYDNVSRASSPVSTIHKSEMKRAKQHRRMNKFMSQIPLCGRKKGAKKDDKKDEKKKKKKTRCLLCCCCIFILVLLAIIIPLVVVFTKKSHHDPTNPIAGTPDTSDDGPTQWLNNTGYPPMKTGVLTIAQPEAVEEESGCVAPTTLWSCALPKEQQKDNEPNKPDQPNFKVQITFENGTGAELSQATRRAANPVSAGAFMRSLLRARATPSASPAVPSVEEMKFLGQTTDENSSPFEGETTPFFMSFQDPNDASSSRLVKRADDPTNITMVIPPPSLNADGTAAPANLLSFPSAQPLRLFNRGKPDEYYGFYTYFDRSIFLKSIDSSNGRGGNPADTNGGSLRDAASLRCTYTQTRFLVQIWTRSDKTKPLLEQGSNTNASKRPGTFPYPVTFTIDRHGGDITKKNLFCYKMENDTTIVDKPNNKFFQFEDRAFGGNLVNGTQGKPNAKGPIDGGSGGCRCKWQNWLD